MGKKGGGGGGTTTQKADPWGKAQPYIIGGLDRLKYFVDDKSKFTPSKDENLMYNMITGMGKNVPSYLSASESILGDTLGGKYLDPKSNPYISSVFNEAWNSTMPKFNTTANQAGRYGSGTWSILGSQYASDLANKVYGENYQKERDRQSVAMQLLPSILGAKLNLYNVAGAAAKTKRTAGDEEYMKALQAYMDAAVRAGGMGGVSSTSTGSGGGPSALSSALAGAGIGGYMAAGTAMGGPVGAVLGGLAGLALS